MEHIIPTPGRIVWYRGADGAIRAAIVAAVHGPFCATLHVFGLNAVDVEAGLRASITHADPEQEPGCFPSWHWMPYQKQQAEKHGQVDLLATHAEMVKASGWTPGDGAGQPRNETPPTTGLTFGTALTALKTGQRVARAGWNGKGMWLILVPGTPKADLREGTPYAKALQQPSCEILPHIDMWTINAEGRRAMLPGWLASQSDMLAEDWLIVE